MTCSITLLSRFFIKIAEQDLLNNVIDQLFHQSSIKQDLLLNVKDQLFHSVQTILSLANQVY